MEGGLALMCFRMLFWVCSLILVLSQDTSGPSATIKILPEYTEQPREGDSVTLDCEISSIQLTDDVLWSRRSSLQEPQIFIVNENGLTSSTDNRFSVSPLQVINSTAVLYSHKITIDPVQQSDQGFYWCFVHSLIMGRYQTVAAADEIILRIHHPDEFPVRFPDGPATVTIGSSLSCKMLSDTKIPSVSDVEMPSTMSDGWAARPTNRRGSPGKEFTRTMTFDCFSNSDVSVVALSCKVGPLTVVSETNTTPITAESPNSKCPSCSPYIAVCIISIAIHLITIATLFFCFYDTRRWQQLHVLGMPRQSSTPRQGNDQQETCNDSEVDYEVPPQEPRTMTPGITVSPQELMTMTPGTTVSPQELMTMTPGTMVSPQEPMTSTPGTMVSPQEPMTTTPGTMASPQEPMTSTPGTMASPPETAEHVYHNVMTQPTCTSSSKQTEDSYMELNPQERTPAVYTDLKL